MTARSPPALLLALATVTVGMPIVVVAAPGGLALLAAPRSGIVLATALIVAPVSVLLALSLRGGESLRRIATALPGGEIRRGIERILLAAAMLAYAIALGAVAPYQGAVAGCDVVASLGLACAWLLLLHAVLNPATSSVRRAVAIAVDVALVSAFLHAGDFLTAAWSAAYLYLAIRDGGRWGAVAASLAGFALVAATTAYWWGQPLLSLGSLAAIAVVPAYVAALLRQAAGSAAASDGADAARTRLYAGLGDGVRDSLKSVLRAGSRLDRTDLSPEDAEILARMRLSARAALVQIDEMPTYAAIEAGEFAPETRSFDLYQLIHGAVATLRPQAADRGTALSVRIDPRLPYELRGWPHHLRQLLIALAAAAIRGSERATVAVQLDLVELAGEAVRLSMTVRQQGGRAQPRAQDPGLAVAGRLAEAMGGRLTTAPRRGFEATAELPFVLDRATAALLLDLDRLPVLIMSEDGAFAGELGATLRPWRAVPRWIGAGDEASAEIEALVPDTQRPVLIVDGRDDVLSALSWAHRAIRASPAAAPYVLFVAAEARIDSVIGLADGVLDAILSSPFTPGVLQSTLHALRVGTADWFPTEPLPAPLVAPEQGPATEPPVQAVPAEPVAAPRGPPQILVAATNAMNRKIIEQILIGARCNAHLVADADQALDMLVARPIDLVLLDLAAATLDEVAAVERLRAARAELPIIVLSADPDPEAGIMFAAAGASTVLGKPLEPSRLTAAIDLSLPRPAPAMPAPDPVVTEISSHPRFPRPAPAPIDRRAVDALWTLGGGGEFFADVVEAFRADSRQLLRDLGGAAAIGDHTGFTAALQSLRRCTASVGGAHLREMLVAMQETGAAELRERGVLYVQQIGAEIARLGETLAEYRKTAE
jgi:DNA-binding response OmpR family regulator/signal transduction histidine kinase